MQELHVKIGELFPGSWFTKQFNEMPLEEQKKVVQEVMALLGVASEKELLEFLTQFKNHLKAT